METLYGPSPSSPAAVAAAIGAQPPTSSIFTSTTPHVRSQTPSSPTVPPGPSTPEGAAAASPTASAAPYSAATTTSGPQDLTASPTATGSPLGAATTSGGGGGAASANVSATPLADDFELRRTVYERDLLRHQLRASANEKEQLRKEMRAMQQQLTEALNALHTVAAAAAAPAAPAPTAYSPISIMTHNFPRSEESPELGPRTSPTAGAPPSTTAGWVTRPATFPPVAEEGGEEGAMSAPTAPFATTAAAVLPSAAGPAASLAAAPQPPFSDGLPVPSTSRNLFSVFHSATAALQVAGEGTSGGALPPLAPRPAPSPTASGPFSPSSSAPGVAFALPSGPTSPGFPHPLVGGPLGLLPIRIRSSVNAENTPPSRSAAAAAEDEEANANAAAGVSAGGDSGSGRSPPQQYSGSLVVAVTAAGGGGGGGLMRAGSSGPMTTGLEAFSQQPINNPFESPLRRSQPGAGTSQFASVATSPRYGPGSVLTSVTQSPAPGFRYGGWLGSTTVGSTAAASSRLTSRPASPPAHSSDLLAAIQKLESMTGAGGELQSAVEAELGAFGLTGGSAELGMHSLDDKLIEALREELDRLRAQVEQLQRDRSQLEMRNMELEEVLAAAVLGARHETESDADMTAEEDRPTTADAAASPFAGAGMHSDTAALSEGAAGAGAGGGGDVSGGVEIPVPPPPVVTSAPPPPPPPPAALSAAMNWEAALLIAAERHNEMMRAAEDKTVREAVKEEAAAAEGTAEVAAAEAAAEVAAEAEGYLKGVTETALEVERGAMEGEGFGEEEEGGFVFPVPAGGTEPAASVSLDTELGPVVYSSPTGDEMGVVGGGLATAEGVATEGSGASSVSYSLPVSPSRLLPYRGSSTAEAVPEEERQMCRGLLDDILGTDAAATTSPASGGGNMPYSPAAVTTTSSIPASPAVSPGSVASGGSGDSAGPSPYKQTSPSAATATARYLVRPRRTAGARALVPYLDHVAASAATAASATGIGQGAAVAAAAAGVPSSSPAAAAAYYSGYSAGVAAGATAAAAIDLPRVASLANMLIASEEEEDTAAAAAAASGGGEDVSGTAAAPASAAESLAATAAGGGDNTTTCNITPSSSAAILGSAGFISVTGRSGRSPQQQQQQQAAVAAVSLAAASGVMRAAAGSVLPPLTAAAVAENLASAAVEAASYTTPSSTTLAALSAPSKSTTAPTSIPVGQQHLPSAAALPARSPSGPSSSVSGLPAPSRVDSDTLAATTVAAAVAANSVGASGGFGAMTRGGQLLFGAFGREGAGSLERTSREAAGMAGGVAGWGGVDTRGYPLGVQADAARLQNLAIGELVTQLNDAESELFSARAALDAREGALREARAALRVVSVEAAQREAALQASLADVLRQLNTFTKQVSEHLARERSALRAQAELQARVAELEGLAAGQGPAGVGGAGQAEEEAYDTVRLVVPSLTMDERALLDEQLAERDVAVVELREQLAEAVEREAEAAELAAQLAWREAQVQSLTVALGRASLLLSEPNAAATAAASQRPPPSRPFLRRTSDGAGTSSALVRPRRASSSDISPRFLNASVAAAQSDAGAYGMPPLSPATSVHGADGGSRRSSPGMGGSVPAAAAAAGGVGAGGDANRPAGQAAASDDVRLGFFQRSSREGMPATPPASPSTSPAELSRATSTAMATPSTPSATGGSSTFTSPAVLATGASDVGASGGGNWWDRQGLPAGSGRTTSRRRTIATGAGWHETVTTVSDAEGGPRRLFDAMMAAGGEALAALGAPPAARRAAAAGAAVEPDEAEAAAARAAAAAASAGLLDPAAAEALRLRLLLESASREIWALRNRLAASDAEAAAQREAQLEGMSGVLDNTGALVSRLRADLNNLRLRNATPPLLARVAVTEQDLEAAAAEPAAPEAAAGYQQRPATGGAAGREQVNPDQAMVVTSGGEMAGGLGVETMAERPAEMEEVGVGRVFDVGGEGMTRAAVPLRRLLADVAGHIKGLQRQLGVESGLRAEAERELQELKQLFDSYVARTVAQVQSGLAGI